jgi:hypothetical protein
MKRQEPPEEKKVHHAHEQGYISEKGRSGQKEMTLLHI